MNSIIEELFYGTLNPSGKSSPEADELLALIVRHETWLAEHLDETAKEVLDKLTDCHVEYDGITAWESFRIRSDILDTITVSVKMINREKRKPRKKIVLTGLNTPSAWDSLSRSFGKQSSTSTNTITASHERAYLRSMLLFLTM